MPEFDLQRLISETVSSPKYAQIAPEVVERVCRLELPRHRKITDAVKATRTKLHQAAGAYLNKTINYAHITYLLKDYPQDALQDFARETMLLHASTAERLPYLDTFYQTCLSGMPTPAVILDLACGFNPFSFFWQVGFPSATYLACDIVLPMLDLLNQLFLKIGNPGKAFSCDLTSQTPPIQADLVLLMKTIPLLDQVDRNIAPRLLEELQANFVLITFPVKSLGGRDKGMLSTYSIRMQQLLQTNTFEAREYLFPNEVAYLLHRR